MRTRVHPRACPLRAYLALPLLIPAAAFTPDRLAASAQQIVGSQQKISETQGGLSQLLGARELFGSALASIGDIDGNTVADVVVGAQDDFGLTKPGNVYVLLLNANGTVAADVKISSGQGGFTGALDGGDAFGAAAVSLGDIDGPGGSVVAVAVGAPGDDDGGFDRGAVWILFLDNAGAVISQQKISDTFGAFTGALDDGDGFGGSLEAIGDFDGNGVPELAVGASGDDDGGTARGAVWVLFLNPTGTVAADQKISDTSGGFGGALSDNDGFGSAVAGLGDLDGDGNDDVAVGALGDDDGAFQAGAVWILFLDSGAAVASQQKISATAGGFGGTLSSLDLFGSSLASLGNVGTYHELAVGAWSDDGTSFNEGTVWVLFLNTDGTVQGERQIGTGQGGFSGTLAINDSFGFSVGDLGDLNGDGVRDLAVGAIGDNDGGDVAEGAVYVLFLNCSAPANQVSFNGTPANPAAFVPDPSGGPRIGQVWSPSITPFLAGATLDFVAVDARPPINVPSASGTFLCEVPPPNQIFLTAPGTPFFVAIPNACGLVGAVLCSQGGSTGPGVGFQLANGIQITIGTF